MLCNIALRRSAAAALQARAKKAKAEGRPQNRIIINELAEYPDLKLHGGKLAEHVGELGNMIARYSARIVMHDLSDELLHTIDTALDAQGTAQQAALDKVRVIRNAMLKTKGVA